MEKVIISNCEPIMNGKAHAVTLQDGRKATAWEDKVDAGQLMQAYAAHTPVDMELVPYMSKAGKSGLNVKSVIFGDVTAPVSTPVLAPVNSPVSLMSVKDIQIISQCMMKCMYYNRCPENEQEVLDTYHGFVKALEENG